MSGCLLVIADLDTTDRISNEVDRNWWTIHRAKLGHDSLQVVARLRPATVILDAREGSESFSEFCRTIRSIEGMAGASIVALAPPDDTFCHDLLEAGADDCWSETIESRGFQIRVKALQRRLHSARDSQILRYGPVELDVARFVVRVNGHSAKLTVMQSKVLQQLMENAGDVTSRRQLIENVWCDPEAEEDSVRTFVHRLRKALSVVGAGNAIRNAPGGYLFEI